jgi:hypothetical protein
MSLILHPDEGTIVICDYSTDYPPGQHQFVTGGRDCPFSAQSVAAWQIRVQSKLSVPRLESAPFRRPAHTPAAQTAIKIVQSAGWDTPMAVKQDFVSADILAERRVIFVIGGSAITKQPLPRSSG